MKPKKDGFLSLKRNWKLSFFIYNIAKTLCSLFLTDIVMFYNTILKEKKKKLKKKQQQQMNQKTTLEQFENRHDCV